MVLYINDLDIVQGYYQLKIDHLTLKKGEKAVLETMSQQDMLLLEQIFNNKFPPNAVVLDGHLRLKGINLLKAKPNIICSWRREAIWLPQKSEEYFHPLHTLAKQCLDALAYFHSLSPKDANKKLKKTLNHLGCDDFWLDELAPDVPRAVLSHLSWGLALALEPSIIIAQEPLSDFDPLARKELIKKISSLLDQQASSLLILTNQAGPYSDFKADNYKLSKGLKNKMKALPANLTLAKQDPQIKNIALALNGVSTSLIKDLTLNITEGQSTAIVCGDQRVTREFCQLITGLCRPKSGTINKTIDLRDTFYYRPQPFLTNLTVFHSLNQLIQHKDLNIAKNDAYNSLYEGLKALNISRPDKILEAFPESITPIEEFLTCLAFVILTKPKLFIMEGVLDVGGIEASADVISLLKAILANSPTSIIITSSLAPENFKFANQLLFLYQGKLLEASSSYEILTNPLHPYSKCLLAGLPLPEHSLVECSSTLNGCPFHPHCPNALASCGWEGRDFQWLLFSLKDNPMLPRSIQRTLEAISYHKTKGVDLEIGLAHNTGLSWQNFLESLYEIMKIYKPAMAKACLGLKFIDDAVLATFPPKAMPKELEIRQGHRLACFLYEDSFD